MEEAGDGDRNVMLCDNLGRWDAYYIMCSMCVDQTIECTFISLGR